MMKHWIQATRPKTLIASLSPMILGTSLALSKGHFSMWVFLATLMTGLGIQISTNFANDLYDFLKGADTADRKGPVRVTQAGLLSVSQVRLGTFLMASMTIILGSILAVRGGPSISFLSMGAVALAFGYTAGPLPLAYLGIAELFVLAFFGPIACGYTYYLQTLQFHPLPFWLGACPGLISCGLLVVNNLRDVAEDKLAKKKTLVARFGTRFGKIEFTLAILLASILPAFLSEKVFSISFIIFFPAFLLIRGVWKNQDPETYNLLLGRTGQLLWLFTLTASAGALL